MGSLANNSPHFARALVLMVLTCFEKDSCVENPKPRYVKSLTSSSVLPSSSKVHAGNLPR